MEQYSLLIRGGPLDTKGGGKFCSVDSAKKSLFSPHIKKIKVQQTDGIFHAGGGDILFGSTREKNYCLVSEMKKNSLLRKKKP